MLITLALLSAALVGVEWWLRSGPGSAFGAPAQLRDLYVVDGPSFGHRPGWRGEQTVAGRTHRITIDRRGMRGADVGPRRPGEQRILVVGDSMVFGQGVADDATIPARLQVLLPGIVAGNAGVIGHGSRDMVQSVRRHAGFGADLVVFCTSLANDFAEDCRTHVDVVEGYLMDGRMARTAQSSYRFRLALRFRTALACERLLDGFGLGLDPYAAAPTPAELDAARLFPKDRSARLAGLFLDRKDDDDPLVRLALSRWEASVATVAQLVSPRPVLLVVVPTWWHLSHAGWRAGLRQAGLDPRVHERGSTQRRLRATAARLGLPLVDLTEALGDAPDRDALWLRDDGHLSPAGCSFTAARLRPAVARLLGR